MLSRAGETPTLDFATNRTTVTSSASPLSHPQRRPLPIRIRVGFLAALVAAVSVALVYFWNTSNLTAQTEALVHTHDVLENLEKLQGSLVDAETGLRGILLTDSPQYLQPYDRAVVQAPKILGELQKKIADNPVQVRSAAILGQLVDGKLTIMRQTLDLYRERGTGPAQDLMRGGAGLRAIDAIRQLIAQMKQEELRLLDSRQRAWSRQVRLLHGVVFTGSSALAFLIIVAARMVYRDAETREKSRLLLDERSRQTELHAEEARLSGEWFRTTLTGIGDAVIATDAQGHITFMNTIAESLTQWRLADAKGQTLKEVFRIVDEETRGPIESPVDRVIREGGIVALANHAVLIGKEGVALAIDDSAAPIRNQQRELVGVVLVFRDVTEQRQEEDQRKFLLQAGTLLASSLDFSKTLAAVADLAVPRIADWCAVELGGDPNTSTQAAVAHVDRAKLESALQLNQRYPPDRSARSGVPHVLRTGKPEYVTEIPDAMLAAGAKDAEHLRLIRELGLKSYMIVPLMVRGKVLGAITFIAASSGRRYGPGDLGFAQELANCAALAMDNARLHTEETLARAQAEAAEQSHRILAESIPAIVWSAGADGINNYYNSRWYEYTGLPAGTVDPTSWSQVCHSEDLALIGPQWELCLAQGIPFEMECRLLRASDRTYRWHLARSVPWKDPTGRTVKWFGTSTDIDDQRRAQEEQRKRVEFEQQLIGIVSHDLRNPISAANMSAAILLRRGELNESQGKALGRILSSTERAQRLIRDLLDLTQARLGGGIPIQPRPQDIHEIARAVVEEVQLAHPERQIHLHTGGPGAGEWDADRLGQIITNLTVNAASYSAPDVPVTVHTLGRDAEVTVEVHNRGEPIPADLMRVLFEPFRRGPNSSTGTVRSVGLGLFIVDQLVKAHGGTIHVTSSVELGTTVRVLLPRTATGPIPAASLANGREH